jgi:CopG family transcriptional regulator/antitoxin EndoAI
MRKSVVWSVSPPAQTARKAEAPPGRENRSRSELVREALRQYMALRERNQTQAWTFARARAGQRKLSIPLDPQDPVESFLSLASRRKKGRERAVLSFPAPLYFDVVMCCADRIALEIASLSPSGGSRRVVARGAGGFGGKQTDFTPGFRVTMF